jgi:hypothetical protein
VQHGDQRDRGRGSREPPEQRRRACRRCRAGAARNTACASGRFRHCASRRGRKLLGRNWRCLGQRGKHPRELSESAVHCWWNSRRDKRVHQVLRSPCTATGSAVASPEIGERPARDARRPLFGRHVSSRGQKRDRSVAVRVSRAVWRRSNPFAEEVQANPRCVRAQDRLRSRTNRSRRHACTATPPAAVRFRLSVC